MTSVTPWRSRISAMARALAMRPAQDTSVRSGHGEQAGLVLLALLVPVHGPVGGPHQLLARADLGGEGGVADAEPDGERGERAVPAQPLAQAGGQHLAAVLAHLGEDDRELVAADPAADVV